MITKKDIDAKKLEFFNNTDDLQMLMKNYSSWLIHNQSEMDEEASLYVDEFYKRFFSIAANNVKKMKDSPEKRKAQRIVGRGLESHQSIDQFLKAMNNEPEFKDSMYESWVSTFTDGIQIFYDFLFDIRKESQNGKELILCSLFHSCIDELISYIHLSKYLYFTQANAHLRTVYESIELSELFDEFPELINTWFYGD